VRIHLLVCFPYRPPNVPSHRLPPELSLFTKNYPPAKPEVLSCDPLKAGIKGATQSGVDLILVPAFLIGLLLLYCLDHTVAFMDGLLAVGQRSVHGRKAGDDSRNCQTLRVPRQSRRITFSFS
jgi:hypothetical protein